MPHLIDRRRFMIAATAPFSVAALGRFWPLTSRGAASQVDDPLFRISLAQWSLHRTLRAGELDNLDFPVITRRDYGLEAVEYVNQFFKDKATDQAYLGELKKRADDNGVTNVLIMCDGEGALGDPDSAARTVAVENHYRWVDAAKYLGCHSIRVNARSQGTPDEQRELAVDGLRRLTEFAAERDMNVIVENHGGISSNGAWLASVMAAVDHSRCGTLPDFGNFRIADGELYDRYQGVAELMPYAKGVSAKSSAFDDQGNETSTDYVRMMRIVLDAGYRGYVGIEYEGSELSEPDGIRATKALLERVRAELQSEYS
ncbi:MAG: sugar phosphate isomerase/epimerase [Gemmatimonadota bacterium]|nr:MAG: sugar phosphate isomerase/epimerase [Gemmatimonadota bacterium]